MLRNEYDSQHFHSELAGTGNPAAIHFRIFDGLLKGLVIYAGSAWNIIFGLPKKDLHDLSKLAKIMQDV
ncbi:hypothetical protein COR50_06245 [Chitinophaga caeni]|uniref:Uncharacterized protein n=1 Tax=Chitinophaga caeni TaxID=2029983 RepID=A0A291QS21_9BACT|nr:hypothetical protein [Chitinophaga caeni]ATL46809.1 hypothetical protein COR50_06245 [Chitinophaga caeni]